MISASESSQLEYIAKGDLDDVDMLLNNGKRRVAARFMEKDKPLRNSLKSTSSEQSLGPIGVIDTKTVSPRWSATFSSKTFHDTMTRTR